MGMIMLSTADETHRSSVRTHCPPPSGATRQRALVKPGSAQCHPVGRRTGLQMAGITLSVWQLAHYLHPDESLVEERSP